MSELGFSEMLCITGLLISLTSLREDGSVGLPAMSKGFRGSTGASDPYDSGRILGQDALHRPEKHLKNLELGAVVFLRLCRLISIGRGS